jgi:hypothetical protein
MERFNRAVRRAHLVRMKEKAKRVYHWSGDRAIKFANHLKSCSCSMCGNPRHYGQGPTRQERLAALGDGEYMPPGRSSKRRARWCRGHVGVEHQLTWRPTAGWRGFYDLVCGTCGRHFREHCDAQSPPVLSYGHLSKRHRWSLHGKVRATVPPLPVE